MEKVSGDTEKRGGALEEVGGGFGEKRGGGLEKVGGEWIKDGVWRYFVTHTHTCSG